MGHISPTVIKTKDKQKVTIRTGYKNDGFAMVELTKSVLLEEKGLIMTIPDFSLSAEDQASRNILFLQHPQTLTLVAEHGMKIIGILTIEPEHLLKTAHRGIIGLIVHANYRSLGIGRKLMELALQWAKANQYYEKIELEVLETNRNAIVLYQQLGFKHEGTIEKAVKHNINTYENLHRMGLVLEGEKL